MNLIYKSKFVLVVLMLFAFNSVDAQTFTGDGPMKATMGDRGTPMVDIRVLDPKSGVQVTAPSSNLNSCGNIGFNSDAVRRCVTRGSFIVNYTGFTPQAQNAFQYAVDVWSKVLNLSVPIEINAQFTALGPGVLGSAGPTNFFGFNVTPTARNPSGLLVYPAGLSDQLAGFDIGGPDINSNFSNSFPFYFGLDGCPAPGEFDFVTVVMHEIGHGLGFLSSDFTFGPGVLSANAGACVGFSFGGITNAPYIFDEFLESATFGTDPFTAKTAAGNTPIAGFERFGCTEGLERYYTNDDLTFVGPNTMACLGGPAKIYAPTTYNGGSSISHFDENTYPGVAESSMMTPFVAPGTAVHDPGCALSVLEDLGYSTHDAVANSQLTVGTCQPPIPTMSEWGLMLFGLLVLNISVFALRRKEDILA